MSVQLGKYNYVHTQCMYEYSTLLNCSNSRFFIHYHVVQEKPVYEWEPTFVSRKTNLRILLKKCGYLVKKHSDDLARSKYPRWRKNRSRFLNICLEALLCKEVGAVHKVHLYLEHYHSFLSPCPNWDPPPPLPQASVFHPYPGTKGSDTRLRVRGWEGSQLGRLPLCLLCGAGGVTLIPPPPHYFPAKAWIFHLKTT